MAAVETGRLRGGQPDYLLLLATAALVIVGLLAVYTSSFAVGYLEFNDANYFVIRQTIFAMGGIFALVFFMRLDYHFLRSLSVAMMGAALLGLIAVLVPGVGVEHNGAARWLPAGPLELQPSEFAKLAMVVYISAWLSSRREQLSDVSLGLLPFVLMVGVVGGLIVVEPDMGTAIVIVMTTVTLFFVAGAPLVHLALLFMAGSAAAWGMILMQPYRLDRMASFLSAENDPQGTGFHILQLLIAQGSGGIAGLGWGASRQKFFYVPGAHTDGIFAIISEELGFIGAFLVLSLFVFFVYRGLRTTLQSRDQFGVLLSVGVVSWIAYQALINLGGITRTIPMTGIPLPFLSYGGSSLVSVMAGVGVLLSVSRYGREKGYHENEPYRKPRTAGGGSRGQRRTRTAQARGRA
ncbi:MAG TPA: putative lipid II flippase FtsW [Dehalococcoidia bacterium]|nr:putative lipid II flippase FtsW [Dehalococcoidia bacterium]